MMGITPDLQVKGLTYRRPADQEPAKGRGKRRRLAAAERLAGSDTGTRK